MTASTLGRTSALPLLPFPGCAIPGLLAAVTAPRDADGYPVDLARTDDFTSALRAALPGGEWRIRWVRQVHGTAIVRAAHTPTPTGGEAPHADALLTTEPGVLLLTRHADCPPLLLWHAPTRTLALGHSGRKGTLANLAGALVSRISDDCGCDPASLVAAIGPGIRACCYAVREDALGAGEACEVAGRHVERRDGRLFLDLPGMIATQLLRAGVPDVRDEAECTCCGPTAFHSYRRDGTPHRFAALAGILP